MSRHHRATTSRLELVLLNKLSISLQCNSRLCTVENYKLSAIPYVVRAAVKNDPESLPWDIFDVRVAR